MEARGKGKLSGQHNTPRHAHHPPSQDGGPANTNAVAEALGNGGDDGDSGEAEGKGHKAGEAAVQLLLVAHEVEDLGILLGAGVAVAKQLVEDGVHGGPWAVLGVGGVRET